jgi:hypothetical protein
MRNWMACVIINKQLFEKKISTSLLEISFEFSAESIGSKTLASLVQGKPSVPQTLQCSF